MRRVSKKRRQLLASVRELEDQYRREHQHCEARGCFYVSVELHHIARGAHRNRALSEPCCWLMLCEFHHDMIHTDGITIVQQLRWKRDSSRRCGDGTYNLERFNEVRGRSKDAITEQDLESL